MQNTPKKSQSGVYFSDNSTKSHRTCAVVCHAAPPLLLAEEPNGYSARPRSPPSSLCRYLALAERHMVSCIQLHLMRPTTGHRSGNAAASGRMGNGRSRDGGAGTSPADGGKGVEGTLARAIILCVCTASASIEVRKISNHFFGTQNGPFVFVYFDHLEDCPRTICCCCT